MSSLSIPRNIGNWKMRKKNVFSSIYDGFSQFIIVSSVLTDSLVFFLSSFVSIIILFFFMIHYHHIYDLGIIGKCFFVFRITLTSTIYETNNVIFSFLSSTSSSIRWKHVISLDHYIYMNESIFICLSSVSAYWLIQSHMMMNIILTVWFY